MFMTLTNVTFSSNVNDNLNNLVGAIWLKNTLMADGSCARNPVISLGNNLDSGSTCGLNATGDLTNTNPLLGPLQDNGGPTPTHALLPGSPAINAGTNRGCPPTDQRGVPRPQGPLCDIGAFEVVVNYTNRVWIPMIWR